MKTINWLLRREFWENKGGFFWAPIIGGGVFVLINALVMIAASAAAGRAHIQLGLVRLDELVKNIDAGALEAAGAGIDLTIMMVVGLVTLISGIVMFFYSIGALYDERRDRSILFWKSLPLSDRDTVLSKALSAGIVAPAIGIVAGMATALATLLVIGVFFAINGQNVFGILFGAGHPFYMLTLAIATLPITALWALPSIGWLMLVSSWARAKPFLWAVGIPVAVGLLVNWFDLMRAIALPNTWFWKHVVGRLLLSVIPGSWVNPPSGNIDSPKDIVDVAFSLPNMYATLGQADIWIGAAAGIAMLVLATRMRRWHDEA